MKLKTEKFYCEKQRVTKIIISDTKSGPVQLESVMLSDKLSAKNSRERLLHDCPTVVRCDSIMGLSS